MDQNGDGVIDRQEWQQAMQGIAAPPASIPELPGGAASPPSLPASSSTCKVSSRPAVIDVQQALEAHQAHARLKRLASAGRQEQPETQISHAAEPTESYSMSPPLPLRDDGMTSLQPAAQYAHQSSSVVNEALGHALSRRNTAWQELLQQRSSCGDVLPSGPFSDTQSTTMCQTIRHVLPLRTTTPLQDPFLTQKRGGEYQSQSSPEMTLLDLEQAERKVLGKKWSGEWYLDIS